MSFQEAFELKKVNEPAPVLQNDLKTHRYMSVRPAWIPGKHHQEHIEPAKQLSKGGSRAYGANVYVGSALAAARAMEEKDGEESAHRRRHISVSADMHAIL